MARGTQFLELRTRLRAEIDRSSDISVGVDDVDRLNVTLNHNYTTLSLKYDWPFLRQVFDKFTLNAGQRFYDFPADLNVERVEKVTLWFNGFAYNVLRNIEIEDYNIWDPTADNRSDPVVKWDVRYVPSVTKEQIEVWPLPATAQQMQFVGFPTLARMTADSDLCRLDDDLIVLFSAAELLASQGDKDASAKLQAAQDHLAYLKKRLKATESSCQIGLGIPEDRRPIRATVRIAGT